MGTNYKNLRHEGSFGDTHATPPDYLAHKDEPSDKNILYTARDQAAGHYRSRNNLFDDSAAEDRRLTLLTHRFLRRAKRRTG